MQESRVKELLRQLNEFEQHYGRLLAESDPNYDTRGEVKARIQLIKQELAAMGVEITWNGSEYHSTPLHDTGNP